MVFDFWTNQNISLKKSMKWRGKGKFLKFIAIYIDLQ